MTIRFLLFSLTLCYSSFALFAQTPTIQDCLGAIPVCNEVYMEDLSPSGVGNYFEINTNGTITCASNETNSIWYTFTVNQTGEFGFEITPNNSSDDYDWWLFDITNATCADINTNGSLTASCNVAGGGSCDGHTGANGSSNYDMQGPGCGSFFPDMNSGRTPYNDFVQVQAGNTYVLCVSNWTGSPFGYTLDFGLSANIGIFDEIRPEISNIFSPTACDDSLIEVVFSENIQCSTIEAANFQLTGPGGPYQLSLEGVNCNNGGEYERTFRLSIDPPIQSLGDFTLEMISDEVTEALDLCDNPAIPNAVNFTVTEPGMDITVDIGNDTALVCVGDVLMLDATFDDATYEWQDGSTAATYTVTEAGVYSVNVTTSCGSGEDAIEVTYLDTAPEINLGNDTILCTGESLSLDATYIGASYQWSDGSNDPTFNITNSGLYAVTVSNACGVAVEEIEVMFDDNFELDLGADRSFCEGTSLTLHTNLNGINIVWQDGSTNSSYEVSTPGTYYVTASTSCATQSDTIIITEIAEPQLALGVDSLLCPNQTVVLNAFNQGATYQWSDGSTNSELEVITPGTYSVTVSTPCGELIDSRTLDFVAPIEIDFGKDTVLCEGEGYFLDAFSESADNYVWYDNSTKTTNFVTGPGNYSVVASNACETVIEEIFIRECEHCETYFPNAFSPNNDGFNDEFRPYSPCEMQDFNLKIFDRWGSMVFETQDVNFAWDGKFRERKAAIGVYIWMAHYTVIEDFKEREIEGKGEILLTR